MQKFRGNPMVTNLSFGSKKIAKVFKQIQSIKHINPYSLRPKKELNSRV